MSQFTSGMQVYGCDVDGKSTGNTVIFTAPQGFVVSLIQLVLTSGSGIITGPIFSIGTNSSSYNNIKTSSLVSSLSVLNNVLSVDVSNPSYHIQTDEDIYIKITTAAIATTYNFQVILIGFPL